MHNLTVICRHTSRELSKELAEQIYEHSFYGKIAIVAEKPVALLAATKKQLARQIRQVQRSRSSTLDATRIAELTQKIAWMQTLKFSAKHVSEMLEADITFGTADSFVSLPPMCSTIYVTYRFNKEKLHMLTSWMPRSGQVIIYERG